MYRQAADEWRIGHTPPETKEQYDAELKAREEEQVENSYSGDDADDENDNDNDKDKDDRNISKKDVPVSNSPRSVNSSLPISSEKRRRRISDDDEEKITNEQQNRTFWIPY